ncbi:MAG: bacillithiol system redox-active protein YtxJ [Cyclobacteriaceae bacterium]
MNWKTLDSVNQLEEVRQTSQTDPVLIFKHSTRCPISSMSLNRLERRWEETNIQAYFLDLISNRDVSNAVEREFGVLHQSPQALLIKGGKVVHHSSHSGIDFDEISAISNNPETV